MQHYEYKFVKVELESGWLSSTQEPKEDYRRIIEEQGKEGWRLVQVFAPPTSGCGWASYFEVIFERPRSGSGSSSVEAPEHAAC